MTQQNLPGRGAWCARPGSTILLAATFATGLSLSAQTTAPAPPSSDETIHLSEFQVTTTADKGYRAGNSVSATRIDTPIKELPFAVSAFTDQFIRDTGARDLFDIVKYAPGVTSSGREFTAGNTRFTIRGYDQLAPQRNGFVGNAYVDTVNVARVEVVKGPASLLYGQIAPGGTVNYITKRATGQAFTQVGAQVGTDNYWRAELDVNQPVLGDRLAFRFNGSWENYFEAIEPAQSRTWVVAPTLTWRITGTTSLTVDYEWFNRREEPPIFMKPNMRITGLVDATSRIDPGFLGQYPLPDSFNYPGRRDYRDSDFESFNAELTQKLGDHWTARANFNWNKNRVANKLTGVADALLGVPAGMAPLEFAAAVLADPNAGQTAPTVTMVRRKRLEESYGHGTALQAEFAGNYAFEHFKFKPLVGFYYNETTSFLRRRESTVAPPAGTANSATTPTQHFQPWNLKDPSTWDYEADYDVAALPLRTFTRTDTTDTAYYAVANLGLLDDRLTAVAGARYNKAESDGINLLSNAAESRSLSRTTPQFGLGYRVRPDVLLYASYSESFVVSNRFLQTLGVIDFSRPASPNTAEGYDVGVKTDLLDGRISSTISYFQIKQKDRVLQFSQRNAAGNTVVTTVQGTEDKSDGFEIEVTLSPTENWQIYASYTYDDVRVTKTVPELAPYVGTRPEATVEQLASLWTRYDLTGDALGGLWLAGGFTYTGEKAQRVDNPDLFFDAYTLWEATVGYDFKWNGHACTASLAWKNITDEEYFPANQQRGLPERLILAVTTRF